MARVVRAHNPAQVCSRRLTNQMRAAVLSGLCAAWEAGPRSAAELKEAAKHFERAAALHPAPAGKAQLACWAEQCRSQAAAV